MLEGGGRSLWCKTGSGVLYALVSPSCRFVVPEASVTNHVNDHLRKYEEFRWDGYKVFRGQHRHRESLRRSRDWRRG